MFKYTDKVYTSIEELKELKTSVENEVHLSPTENDSVENRYGKHVFTSTFHSRQARQERIQHRRITQPLDTTNLMNSQFNNYVVFKDCKFSNIRFRYVSFESLIFYECIFENCEFFGCYFLNTALYGVKFNNCMFLTAYVKKTVISNTTFIGQGMQSKALMSEIMFKDSIFKKNTFRYIKLRKVLIDNCGFNENNVIMTCNLYLIHITNNTKMVENGLSITNATIRGCVIDSTAPDANKIIYSRIMDDRRFEVMPPGEYFESIDEDSFIDAFASVDDDIFEHGEDGEYDHIFEDGEDGEDDDDDENEGVFDVLNGKIYKNKEYKPERMQRKRLQKSAHPVTRKDTYHDLIELEDKGVLETVNSERNTFAFKIHNEFYVISRDELINVMNDSTNIRYECPTVDSFVGIKMEQPYLNLPSIGAVITGVVSFFDLWNIIKTNSNIRHKVFELVPTDKMLASTASHDAVYNHNYVSSAHCQSGQESRVYDIRIMWVDVKVPWKSQSRRLGKQMKSRSRTRSRETKKAKSFTRSKSKSRWNPTRSHRSYTPVTKTM